MRLLSCLLLLAPSIAWFTNNGKIFNDAGEEARFKGMSWFGWETQDKVINGLWSNSMDSYLKILHENDVNILRIPFCSEWILYYPDVYPYEGMVSGDPENQHKKSIEILDTLFQKTEELGIGIMLDLHRLTNSHIAEYWYEPNDGRFTADSFLRTWYFMLDRYHDKKNLVAIDLLNEPHGGATFGSGNPSTDWRLFAESAIEAITNRYPTNTWLLFVEGVGWGKMLGAAGNNPIRTPNQDVAKRIIYSPHSYGKSVVPYINVYDTNGLRRDWNSNFGYLCDQGKTVVTGEWGGRTDIDSVWMSKYADYLIEKNMQNNFFWSLGPNSGDVQGFLKDDWSTVDEFKRDLIKRVQPNPVLPL